MKLMNSRMLVLAAAVALSACGGSSEPTAPSTASDPATETFASSLGVNLSQRTKTSAGDYFQDLVVGTGAAMVNPPGTTNVIIDYTGWLKTGSQFDSALAARFPLGGVITGFPDVMNGMRIGGTRLVVIRSANGYGNAPQVGIPANSTLVFRIKLDSFF
jgi:FKBP-type peptidyl-prolyl cis-trans isomerase FkpA